MKISASVSRSAGWLFLTGFIFFLFSCSGEQNTSVSSPGGQINVEFTMNNNGQPNYKVRYNDTIVLNESSLGIIRKDADFSTGLSLASVSGTEKVNENYTMPAGKKNKYSYKANRKVYHLKNSDGEKMDVIFQVSDDGVAFRYAFPEKDTSVYNITAEKSGFAFPDGTITFIQQMDASKTGWSKTQPSYEEYYDIGVGIDTLRYHDAGWVLPALFNQGKYWMLISETAPDRNYCGSRLMHEAGSDIFTIGFPQKTEGFGDGPVYPESNLPWKTPWRIIALGNNLGTIVSSTLGTDLAEPSRLSDISFVKPGKSSWSWVLYKDDSTIFSVQKRFIDYASDMGWAYTLVDADWDQKIGYDSAKMLADYGRSKGVGILLWYNSSGDWNTTVYTPKSKLLTHADREKEFSRLKEMGIKGIKVDFFGGDGQSMMSYYQDIFEDAGKYGLLVNCHGTTLPRGWERTYPNLLTMEAVRGFEFLTFEQANTNHEPSHSCVLPYTRNVFDPMDFTPVCFSEIPNMHRLTTNSFELALSVLFYSGIQHYAEVPEGMASVPVYVKDFMKEVPSTWDEIKFLQGYPGKLVVMARRKGNTWYIAGINGENSAKNISVNTNFIPEGTSLIVISDGETNRTFSRKEMKAGEIMNINLQPIRWVCS